MAEETPDKQLNLELLQKQLVSLRAEADEAISRIAASAKLLEQATSQSEEISDARGEAALALGEMQSTASQLRALATEALAAKTQIDDHQTVVATKSEHIEQAQLHADKVRAHLDRQLTAATTKATEADAFKDRAEAAAAAATEQLAEAKAAKISAESERDETVNFATEALEAMKSIRSLSTRSDNIEERVRSYEAALIGLQEEMKARILTIDGLLPGATSAGLSSAFDLRRKSFLEPSSFWQRVFVGAIGSLVILALTGLWSVYTNSTLLSYDELFRVWLARLPVAGALLWLALYASRESALAKRLEEDYGYKSAIAASFQGFHKQMSDIATQAEPNSPLAQLCTDTLATIASPPGRIYDKHQLTVTPTTEVTQIVKSVLAQAIPATGPSK